MSQYVVPSIDTHIPKTASLPAEPAHLSDGRPDLPTPSLWQNSVRCTHKVTGKPAIVVRVDYGTNMFRAFFPEEGDIDPDTQERKGRFAERTEWEHCANWDVEVTYSPKELERQAARAQLEMEISKLDATGLAAVTVLCDDPDPTKALAKLEALRALGVVKVSSEAAKVAVDAVKKAGAK